MIALAKSSRSASPPPRPPLGGALWRRGAALLVGAGAVRFLPMEGEEGLEGGVEGLVVPLVLDHGRAEGVLEGRPVTEVHVLQGGEGVDRLDHRHRHPDGAQLVDEGDHRVDHRRSVRLDGRAQQRVLQRELLGHLLDVALMLQ